MAYLESGEAGQEYVGLKQNEKDKIWVQYNLQLTAEQAKKERTRLNVGEPEIDLNRCSMDDLDLIPILTLEVKKKLMYLRHQHAAGIRNWKEVRDVQGIGLKMLLQIMIFCKDLVTTPLSELDSNVEQAPAPKVIHLPNQEETAAAAEEEISDGAPGLQEDMDSEAGKQKLVVLVPLPSSSGAPLSTRKAQTETYRDSSGCGGWSH